MSIWDVKVSGDLLSLFFVCLLFLIIPLIKSPSLSYFLGQWHWELQECVMDWEASPSSAWGVSREIPFLVELHIKNIERLIKRHLSHNVAPLSLCCVPKQQQQQHCVVFFRDHVTGRGFDGENKINYLAFSRREPRSHQTNRNSVTSRPRTFPGPFLKRRHTDVPRPKG